MLMRTLLLAVIPMTVHGQEAVTWSAEAELGYGYDSNVAVDEVDLNTSKGDQFTDISVAGGLAYQGRHDVEWTLDATLSEKQYVSFDEFDGLLGLVSLGIEKKFARLSAGADLRHVRYRLDGDGFLTMWQIAPYVGFFPSRHTYARVTWEYGAESFDEAGDRDNSESRFELLGYYFLSGLRRHFTLRYQYGEAGAEDDLYDNRSRDARLTYHHEFDGGTRLRLGYRVQWRDYDALRHPAINGFRADRRERAELSVTWPLADRFLLSFEAYDNDFSSNLESADYDQQVYQLSLKYRRQAE